MKKNISLLAIIGLAILNILIYWNTHLYLVSQKKGDLEERIKLLDRAETLWPFYEGIYHELGKAYFEMGLADIGDSEQREQAFTQSQENHQQAIRLNPGWYQCL